MPLQLNYTKEKRLGLGTFRQKLIDELYLLKSEDIIKNAKICIELIEYEITNTKFQIKVLTNQGEIIENNIDDKLIVSDSISKIKETVSLHEIIQK